MGGTAAELDGAKALKALDVGSFAARALAETGDGTLFIPWLRTSLADLKTRLEATSRSAAAKGHRPLFGELAVQVGQLQKFGL